LEVFHKLGVSYVSTPNMFFRSHFGAAASLVNLKAPQTPDEPIVLIMEYVPVRAGKAAEGAACSRRMRLLQTPYETFERNVREQLGRVLGRALDAGR